LGGGKTIEHELNGFLREKGRRTILSFPALAINEEKGESPRERKEKGNEDSSIKSKKEKRGVFNGHSFHLHFPGNGG